MSNDKTTLEITSCSDARTQGLLFYFTGKPCPRGHVAARYVANRACSVCDRAQRPNRTPEENLHHVQTWYANLTDEERRDYNTRKSRNWRKKQKPTKVEGVCTSADVEELMRVQLGLCAGCSRAFSSRLRYEVDHKTPPSRGGTHWPHNRQLLCRSCNAKKRNKTMEEWKP
jgi:hypothetical protein